MPKPTIAQAYAAKRAAFVYYTPFGVLLEADYTGLIRSTARDAGVTVAEVLEEIDNG